jgi:hypothetical protein
MTFRQSLARYVRGLLLEETSPPAFSDPPTPSQESTPPTTTPSTRDRSNAISEAGLLTVVLETMERMNRENAQNTRELVIEILQGREIDPEILKAQAEAQSQPLRTSFDPPDYDAPGTDDLPGGIAAVFEREEQEADTVRQLRTQQEVLARQLDEARAMLTDPQGPGSELSSSMD